MKLEHNGNSFYLSGTPEEFLTLISRLSDAVRSTLRYDLTAGMSVGVIGKQGKPLDNVHTKDYPAALFVNVYPEERKK
jgi:hypothetical protein